jgi:hypothetical protein
LVCLVITATILLFVGLWFILFAGSPKELDLATRPGQDSRPYPFSIYHFDPPEGGRIYIFTPLGSGAVSAVHVR